MKKILKSKLFFFLILIAVIITVRHIICINKVFFIPDYPFEQISEKSDSDMIFKYCGLSPYASEEMLENGDFETVKEINKLYFEKFDYKRNYIMFPISYAEQRSEIFPMAYLKDGDILVGFNTCTLDWRHGHSAIVTDAKKGIILEHSSVGNTSCFSSAEDFGYYPSFVILRYPDEKVANLAADYAKNSLIDIDYRILAGIVKKDKSDMDILDSSNCSHIVWQAYKKFGIDIDSNGGPFVTPYDIAMSDKLKAVQIIGVDPDDYKDRLLK